MKIWHISDTHSFHKLLSIPDDVDMVIHSCDFSNYRDVFENGVETKDFLNWYAALPIKNKILIAGNHDAIASQWNHVFRKNCELMNITYLENESVTIDGVKIWGSPYTPTFGNWYFMKARHKLDKIWSTIPNDTDIMVIHGPPKGFLDLSYNRNGKLKFCGCNALRKAVRRVEPKLCLFGHIHSNKDIINAGTKTVPDLDTIFSNGSVVTDEKFGQLSSNGNIFHI